MIKLQDALITDSLPLFMSDDVRIQALAYAINRQVRKIIALADAAKVYDDLQACREEALDMIGYELRIPIYKDSYDIETKRKMVSNALKYWTQMGTVSAIEQLCSDVFKSAKVIEWFDYGGEPGHFMIDLGGYRITQADVDKFVKDLDTFKRLSAHLDMLRIKLEMNLTADDRLRYGILPITVGKKTIGLGFPDCYEKRLYAGVGGVSHGRKTIGLGHPDMAENCTYSGQVHLVTGRKTIGGRK